MSKIIIDQLKKSIANYVSLVYGQTLEEKLEPANILEPKQKIVVKKDLYLKTQVKKDFSNF